MKQKGAKLQNEIGKLLKPIPLHPNHITALSLIFAAIGSYFTFRNDALAVLIFLIAFCLDALDGAVARAKSLCSTFGAYMDGICDRLVEFLALLPFFFNSEFLFPTLLTLFFGTCMTSFSKAYASHRKLADEKTAAGMKTFMPRAERVIGIWLVLALFLYGEISYAWYLLWAMAAVSVLSFVLLQYEACKIGARKNR